MAIGSKSNMVRIKYNILYTGPMCADGGMIYKGSLKMKLDVESLWSLDNTHCSIVLLVYSKVTTCRIIYEYPIWFNVTKFNPTKSGDRIMR